MDTDETDQVNRSRLLFAVALAGVLLYTALDAVAQSLPPHYSPVSQAESDLAVGPYGYVMTLNFINRGILSLCFLFALMLAANSDDVASHRLRRGSWLFAVWSVGALLLAAFPTDVPPAPLSLHGAIHLVVAVAAFLGGASGALYISLGMAGNRALGKARGVAVPLAYLTVALCVVVFGGLVPGVATGYGGLTERVFLGSLLLWVAVVSAVMLEKPIIKSAP
ncbi:MAG: DUF998 domain-containing protein [Nitrososphaerota archaeon]|nr:DUF998 domain-containing protein [Nitrososphaerota archaeon]